MPNEQAATVQTTSEQPSGNQEITTKGILITLILALVLGVGVPYFTLNIITLT